MTEGLFLITTLFVAYVVYVIVNEKKTEGSAKKPAVTVKQPEPVAAAVEKPKMAVSTENAKIEPAKTNAAKSAAAGKSVVSPKPAAAEKPATSSKPVAATKEVAAPKPAAIKKKEVIPAVVKGSGLKNPINGEVATTYGNYRFTKRWIKDALVAEGLVDKVYKNDELNADVEAKIKEAIAKLEGNKKYQP